MSTNKYQLCIRFNEKFLNNFHVYAILKFTSLLTKNKDEYILTIFVDSHSLDIYQAMAFVGIKNILFIFASILKKESCS